MNIANSIKTKVTLKWYYHDPSDTFFPEADDYDFGHEIEFITEIGEYHDGSVEELRKLLQNSKHFLFDTKDLESLIDNQIEQF
jgi:hypothetical protein